MKNKIKTVLYTFAFVTTCVLFATAFFTTIFYGKSGEVGTDTLWQILGVSGLCSAGSLIYPEHEVSKRTLALLKALHYVYVNVVVLGCGIWFGWFQANSIPMVGAMVLMIAVIFLGVSAVMWKSAKNTATLMNERLAEYQNRNAEEN